MQTSGRKQGFIISKAYVLPACPTLSSTSSGKCAQLCLVSTALCRDTVEIKLEDTTLDTALFIRVDDQTLMDISLICPDGTSVMAYRLGEAQSHSPSLTALLFLLSPCTEWDGSEGQETARWG